MFSWLVVHGIPLFELGVDIKTLNERGDSKRGYQQIGLPGIPPTVLFSVLVDQPTVFYVNSLVA